MENPPDIDWDGRSVSPDRWGRDHWSTLSYLGHRHGDWGDLDKMRCKPGNPRTGAMGSLVQHLSPKEYPTRLRDGSLRGHDDYDCAADLVRAGLLVETGTGANPRFELTNPGAVVWAYVVKTRQTCGAMDSLSLDEVEAQTGVRIAFPEMADPCVP